MNSKKCHSPWSKVGLVCAVLLGALIIKWSYSEVEKKVDYYNAFYRPPTPSEHMANPDKPMEIPRLLRDEDTFMRFIILKQMNDSHSFRCRWTHADNTPYGRLVYWNMPYNWWVQSLTYLTALFSGLGYNQSLELTGTWANPFMELVMILGLGIYLPRFLGYGLTSLIVVITATLPGTTLGNYVAFHCDHDPLLDLTFLASLNLLVTGGMGWTSSKLNDLRRAEKCFAVSGIFVGIGFWVGASRETVAWTAAGLGILVSIVVPFGQNGKTNFVYQPSLWRRWGRAAALTSLIAYALEYCPNHLGLTTLEINMPLHALSLFCAGELFALLAMFIHQRSRSGFFPLYKATLLLLGLCFLPVLIFFAPADLVSMKSPELSQLVRITGESKPAIEGITWSDLFSWFGVLPFLPLVGIGLARNCRASPMIAAHLLFTSCSALLLILLYLFHMYSWSYFLFAGLISTLVSLCLALRQMISPLKWKILAFPTLAACLTIQSCCFAATDIIYLSQTSKKADGDLEESAIIRQTALKLKNDNGGKCLHFMSSCRIGLKLAYFAEGEATGSDYENLAGITSSMDFFSDTGAMLTARDIASKRKIDYVVVDVDLGFLLSSVRGPIRYFPDVSGNTLGEHLCLPNPQVPEWLEALPEEPLLFPSYPLPVRVFKVLGERL